MPASVGFFGSPGQARTADLVINSHPLYQLSYRGIAFRERRNDTEPTPSGQQSGLVADGLLQAPQCVFQDCH